MRVLWKIMAWVTYLVSWELLARSGEVNPKLFPGPWGVAMAFADWAQNGTMLPDIFASLARVLVGLLIGTSLGVSLGIGTGRFRVLDFSIGSIVNGLRAIPPVALVPLAILWFGISEGSKVYLVAWGVFFPVWLNTHLGIRNLPRSIEWTARSFGVKGLAFAMKVLVPGAAPQIVAGIRLAIGLAFICVFVAELTGASRGIGFRIATSHLVFRADLMLAGMVTLGAFGALSDFVFVRTVRRIAPWLKGN